MPAGPTVSKMGSIVPWMLHQISPSLLVERKVAVSVIAQLSTTTSSGSRSPTKCLNLRTECIDQLSKWHSLLQGGAISQDQYDEMKNTIMEDMKSMK